MPPTSDPHLPATSQGQGGCTRASMQNANPISKADLLADPSSTIKMIDGTRTFLDRHGFIAKDDLVTMEQLSYVLLSLAHSFTRKAMHEGARVVALLMVDNTENDSGTAISRYVEKNLTPFLNSITTALDAAKQTMEMAKATTEEAHKAVEDASSA